MKVLVHDALCNYSAVLLRQWCRGSELIVAKLRQLRRPIHHLVAHQQRWGDLGVTMLAGVQIEHELPERAREPRQPTLKHNETGAGELGSSLEIHLAERLAEIKMLLGPKAVVSLGPKMMMLDVLARILAVRHLVERQIRYLRKRLFQSLGELPFLLLQVGNQGLERGDLGQQLLGRFLLVAFLGRADFLGSGIAPRLGGFGFADRGAAALVDLDEPGGLRRQPAPGQRAIKGGGIFANPFDVVHDLNPAPWPEQLRPSTNRPIG